MPPQEAVRPPEPVHVHARNVSKSFDAVGVLDEISFSVAARERIVICGPSGSGKSTLIRCVSGLEPFQGGSIEVLGNALPAAASTTTRLSGKVGMVFQAYNLFPHLTVLGNCTLALRRVLKLSPTASEERARDYLRRLHIENHALKKPFELSGGQQQRAAIARSLCMQPEILLFDEPTSALDPEMVGEVLDAMTEATELGITTMCVTHELEFARHVADRVIFMDHGRIVEQGRPSDLFDNPQSPRLQQFLGQLLHKRARPDFLQEAI